jgi:predicted CXXCH cytochrome family protein
MIRVSGRDYNGLIESPCYKGGKFSCLSCHSLHKSEPDGLLARNRGGDAACIQCHQAFQAESKLVAHTHHKAGSSGSECFNCHMPRTTYGVLKAIRSHQVSSPRVAVELATGRPNACNLCHLDKSLAWTAQHLESWFAQPQPQLSDSQRDVADSVRLALAGDAGQRALVAWHLGWNPADGISGTSWMAPVLGQLLDDPYAAVRYIAERSLRQLAKPPPANYDFAVEPADRQPIRPAVWEEWRKQLPSNSVAGGAAPTRVNGDLTLMDRQFQELLDHRDNRPVRLRE